MRDMKEEKRGSGEVEPTLPQAGTGRPRSVKNSFITSDHKNTAISNRSRAPPAMSLQGHREPIGHRGSPGEVLEAGGIAGFSHVAEEGSPGARSPQPGPQQGLSVAVNVAVGDVP